MDANRIFWMGLSWKVGTDIEAKSVKNRRQS